MTPLNRAAALISAGALVVVLGASALAVTTSPQTAASTRPAVAAAATCAPLDVQCQLLGPSDSPTPTSGPTGSPTASPTASPSADATCAPLDVQCQLFGPSDSPTPSASATATPSPSAGRSPSPSPTKATSASPTKASASASPVANPPVAHTVKFTPLGYKNIGTLTVRTTQGYATVLGHGGVPSTGVDQVLIFVTTQSSSTSSSLRSGATVLAPTQKGVTRHALDLVRLDTSGRIPLRVDKGSTKASISVVGFSGLTSTSAYERIATRKQVTTAPATLTQGKRNTLTLALPGVPSSNRTRWAAVVHLTISPVGSASTGVLSATVNGSASFVGVSSYTAGTDSTVTVVLRPNSKGQVAFRITKGSVIVTMTETAAWVPGAKGTAFSSWPQGRVKAI